MFCLLGDLMISVSFVEQCAGVSIIMAFFMSSLSLLYLEYEYPWGFECWCEPRTLQMDYR